MDTLPPYEVSVGTIQIERVIHWLDKELCRLDQGRRSVYGQELPVSIRSSILCKFHYYLRLKRRFKPLLSRRKYPCPISGILCVVRVRSSTRKQYYAAMQVITRFTEGLECRRNIQPWEDIYD